MSVIWAAIEDSKKGAGDRMKEMERQARKLADDSWCHDCGDDVGSTRTTKALRPVVVHQTCEERAQRERKERKR